MRGGYNPPASAHPAGESGFHGGPGTPLVQQQSHLAAAGGAQDPYSGDAGISGDGYAAPSSASPMGREGSMPHQFQRQNALGTQHMQTATQQDSASVADAAGAPLGGVSPLARQASAAAMSASAEYAPPHSPFRQGSGGMGATTPFAVAEEKDGGSVRSSSKRAAALTTPTQPAAQAAITPGASGKERSKEKNGTSPVPTRSSPYSAGYSVSPNLRDLVKTGEKRNGVPVTTVNLGYSSGIKRGMSFRDSPTAAVSPKSK